MNKLSITFSCLSIFTISSGMDHQAKRALEARYLNAADSRDFPTIKSCLAAGVNPNALDVFGRNVSHKLCLWEERSQDREDIKRLLQNEDINLRQQETLAGNTPLHILIRHLDYGFSSHFKTQEYISYVKIMITREPSLLTIQNQFKQIPLDFCLESKKDHPEINQLVQLLTPSSVPKESIIKPRLLYVTLYGQTDFLIQLLQITKLPLIAAILDYTRFRECGLNHCKYIHEHLPFRCNVITLRLGGAILVRFLMLYDFLKKKGLPAEIARHIAVDEAAAQPNKYPLLQKNWETWKEHTEEYQKIAKKQKI